MARLAMTRKAMPAEALLLLPPTRDQVLGSLIKR